MDPLEIAHGDDGTAQLAGGRRIERLMDGDEAARRWING
jgi:hypothetical protein